MTTKHANGRTYVRQTFEEAVAALHSRCVRDEETGCLVHPTAVRYTEISAMGIRTTGHRATYIVMNGPICADEVVRHKCDRTQCVEPTHLEAGTASQNTRDMFDRNRRDNWAIPQGEARAGAKLTVAIVDAMRREARAGRPLTEIAASFGQSYTSTHGAVRGDSWSTATEPPVPRGYTWQNSARRVPADVVAAAREMYDAGASLGEVARELGIGRSTAWSYCSHSRRGAASA